MIPLGAAKHLTISKSTINVTRRRKHPDAKIGQRRHRAEVSRVNRAIPRERIAPVFAEIVHRCNFSKRFLLLYYYTARKYLRRGVTRTVFFFTLLFLFLRNNVRNRYIVVTKQEQKRRIETP